MFATRTRSGIRYERRFDTLQPGRDLLFGAATGEMRKPVTENPAAHVVFNVDVSASYVVAERCEANGTMIGYRCPFHRPQAPASVMSMR